MSKDEATRRRQTPAEFDLANPPGRQFTALALSAADNRSANEGAYPGANQPVLGRPKQGRAERTKSLQTERRLHARM
jgi:hypothetical protein